MAAGRELQDKTRSGRHRGLTRWVRGAGIALLLVSVLFVGGFGVFAFHISALVTPDDPESADAIIVLTGGQSRIGSALELLRSGKGKRLLISGVNPVADADDLRAATGAAETLFSCCVDIDHVALDTIGNAEEGAKWMRANAFDSVILVTNNYHMPRSLLEMRRHLSQAALKPYPVVNARLDGGSWITKPRALRVLMTEYAKFLAATMRSLLPAKASRQQDQSYVASRAVPVAR